MSPAGKRYFTASYESVLILPIFHHIVIQVYSIYFESHDLFTLERRLVREHKKVKKWFDANRLSLNIVKTNFVIFHSKPTNFNELKIKGHVKVIFLPVIALSFPSFAPD